MDQGIQLVRLDEYEERNQEITNNINNFSTQLAQITYFPEDFGAKGGNTDDTIALQTAIDFVIANKAKLRIEKNYKVNPKLMTDGSKVCLLIYQSVQDNSSHAWDSGAEIEFAKGARIFTESNEECTLIRLKASNVKIVNPDLRGVRGKTVLLELSRKDRLDNTEVDFIVYNTITTGRFYNAKCAIQMEGQAFYNTFDDLVFVNCARLIWLKESEYQLVNNVRNSNVNRNRFSKLTANVSNGEGIYIDYGDTNTFTDIAFEGLSGYCIYLKDQTTLKPGLYYTENNVFTNVMFEACPYQIYNDAKASQFFAVMYSPKTCEFIQLPRNLVGSMDSAYSPSVHHSFVSNTEDTFYLNKKWASVAYSQNGLYAKNFCDYETPTTSIEGVLDFTIEQCTNVTSIRFNGTTSKPIYKSIGKIMHYLCRLSVSVSNVNEAIVLPLPRMPRSNTYAHGEVTRTTKTAIVTNRNTGENFTVYASIGTLGITIEPVIQLSVVDGALVKTKAWFNGTFDINMEIEYLI